MDPAKASTIQTFPPQTQLIAEKELSRKMYVIRSGTVRVYKTYLGKKITLATLGQGEVFGELSFFDAQPRSASVETLTEVSAIVVDGALAQQQIEQLPSWVMPLLKSVFHRFRETDLRLATMQNLADPGKKTSLGDSHAHQVFTELVRFVKALVLIYERDELQGQKVHLEKLQGELIDFLGANNIGVPQFLKVMEGHEYITVSGADKKVIMNREALEHWLETVSSEAGAGRAFFLSHSTFGLLRRIVGFLETEKSVGRIEEKVVVTLVDLDAIHFPFFQEAVAELKERTLADLTDRGLEVIPRVVMDTFFCQTVVKSFDPTGA